MAPLEQFFAASFYQPSAELLASVSQAMDAHRLRIWDTRSGAIQGEFQSSTEFPRFTCIAWGAVGSSSSSLSSQKKKRKASGLDTLLPIVALGTAEGSIVLYSVHHGDTWKTLGGSVHTQGITDFVWNQDGSIGFSCSSDGWIVEWDINEGAVKSHWRVESQEIARLALSPEGDRLLSAGHNIKLWNLATRQVEKTWTGHGSKVTSLLFSPCGANVVSIAEQDRFVHVWSIRGKDVPVMVLTMDNHATAIAFREETGHLLAVTEDGVVNIWQKPLEAPTLPPSNMKKKKKKHHSKPCDSVIRVEDPETAVTIPILRATFLASGQIMVAYGSALRPQFDPIVYMDGSSILKTVALSRSKNSSMLMDQGAAKHEMESSKQMYVENQSTIVMASGVSLVQPQEALREEIEEFAVEEVTLEDKLKALQVLERVEKNAPGKRVVPKADSLQQMLLQALRTQDKALLEECLVVGDARVIYNTVQRLPSPFVLTLLKEIVQRFQARPGRGRTLARWIRSILLVHMSYLMTLPNLTVELAPLYQLVDERLSNFKKLLRLQGRLDVIEHQVRQRTEAAQQSKSEEQDLHEPMYVYDENQEMMANGAMEEEDSEDVTDVEEDWHMPSAAVDDDFMEEEEEDDEIFAHDERDFASDDE